MVVFKFWEVIIQFCLVPEKLNAGPDAWREIGEAGRSPDELRRLEEHERNLKNCVCLIEKKEKTEERKKFKRLSYEKAFFVKRFFY